MHQPSARLVPGLQTKVLCSSSLRGCWGPASGKAAPSSSGMRQGRRSCPCMKAGSRIPTGPSPWYSGL